MFTPYIIGTILFKLFVKGGGLRKNIREDGHIGEVVIEGRIQIFSAL